MLLSVSLLLLLSWPVLSIQNRKRGIAYAEDSQSRDLTRLSRALAGTVSWLYSWSVAPPTAFIPSLQFVPMQWGGNGIETLSAAIRKQGVTDILTFNEPDMASQSNLSPGEAALLWKKHIQPLSMNRRVRLGAPAVTSSPDGRAWLSSFIALCSDCRIDFIPIHWYGTGIGNFYDYLWQMHGEFPRWPLWVTEYASTSDNDAEVVDFLNSTVRYMDTLNWIERYAWFALFRDDGKSHYSLLDANGNLNAIGRAYFTI